MRQIGGEGIVSKRRRSLYRGGESREWLKTKCSETGLFAITGFSELGDGRLDAVYVAEARERSPSGKCARRTANATRSSAVIA